MKLLKEMEDKKYFVSGTCIGEICSVCGKDATNKLGEEIPYDDPHPHRHNLTAYVCREHFLMIVGRNH
jgi:hypothetical protein